MQAQLASCCCDLKTAIHSEGEETRALIQGNTIQDLRDQLAAVTNQLSQTAQNNTLIAALKPYPVPAVPFNAYYGGYYGNSCNGCGC
jgi:hypothetical protein